MQTFGFQNTSSPTFLLFLTLAVQRTALRRGAFLCSSSSNLVNKDFFTSRAFGERRELGSLIELITPHSLSTSLRYNCCRCFRKMGFFHAALAIWASVPRQHLAQAFQPFGKGVHFCPTGPFYFHLNNGLLFLIGFNWWNCCITWHDNSANQWKCRKVCPGTNLHRSG